MFNFASDLVSMEYNDKQLQILQVAETLFAEKGFDGTSVRDIAKAAKINIAMVSYYFGSKEKMLESLIIFRIADLKIQLESLYQQDISPLEKIDRLVELYVKRISENRCIYKIIHFELSAKKRELNLKSFTEVKRNNLLSVEKIIKDGQDRGVFTKNVNVTLIPTTILGTFFHFQMNKEFYKEMFDLHSDSDFETYINTEIIQHIQQTIKALLTYESK